MAKEPYVNLTLSAANTEDKGLSRFNNLTIASLLVSDKGPDGITLITSPKELLEKYNYIDAYDQSESYSMGDYVINNGKVYIAKINNPGTDLTNQSHWTYLPGSGKYKPLSADLHHSFHHIYSILDDCAVLVIKYGATYTPVNSGNANADSLSGIFGTLPFVRYSSKVAISDTGNSYLVDTNDNVLNAFFIYNAGEISIQSVAFNNLLASISGLGCETYSYQYDTDNNLKIVILFSTTAVDWEDINAGLNITNAPQAPNITIPTYNLLLTINNELGYTLENNAVINDTFQITSVNTSSGVVGINISGVADTLVITANAVNYDNQGDYFGIIKHPTNPSIINSITTGPAAGFVNFMGSLLSPSIVNPTDFTISGAISAMNSLLDYDGGYRIDMIFDSGICDAGYHSALNSLAKSLFSLAVVSIDEDLIGDMTAITNFIGLTAVADAQTYRLSPYNITSFGDHPIKLSPITEYIRVVSNNKNNQSEFAPAFGLNNGVVAFTNLTKNFTISERELLLDLKVNSIKRDLFRARSFINKNVTALSADNLFKEEQIIRTANRIGWDCNYLSEQFLGALDTLDTARSLTSVLNNYYSTTFGNQIFKPEKFEVICDITNNEFGDGELNVVVNIYVSLALVKINVLVKALPLSAL